MVDADLIAAKLGELHQRLERIGEHRRESSDELPADRDALELVPFNLMLGVQSGLDVARRRRVYTASSLRAVSSVGRAADF